MLSMSTEQATPRILVVDDCTITCNLLTAILTTEGYHVTAASDGTSGLAAARDLVHDLAIVDLHLPDLSGIELAGLLQPEIPFLALTIDRSPAAIQACIDKGALGYLVKPLDAETFLRHVHVALERGREQRNLRRALRDNHIVNKALGRVDGVSSTPGTASVRGARRARVGTQRQSGDTGRGHSRGERNAEPGGPGEPSRCPNPRTRARSTRVPQRLSVGAPLKKACRIRLIFYTVTQGMFGKSVPGMRAS